jgi:hypothetical protein
VAIITPAAVLLSGSPIGSGALAVIGAVKHGTGPTRTITNVHGSGSQHGLADAGNGPSEGSE